MLLVAGGTGTLGSLVADVALRRGERVRVLTRDPVRASRAAERGAEITVGDVRDAAAVQRAVAGVRTVVSCVQGFAGVDAAGPAAVDDAGNRHLVDAARAAGAEHVVLLSTLGAAADHPIGLFRAKYRAEEHLRSSGLAWTIVRSAALMETWVANLRAPIAARGQAFVLGRGDSPVSFVAARDVAALVDLAVREPALRGRVVDVAGPEDVTINDFVGLLAAAHGADVPVRHVPLPVVRALAVLLRPVKPTAARILEAAAVMDTAPERTPDEARARPPGVPTTRLADVIRSAAPTT